MICKLRYGSALKAVIHRKDDEMEEMYLKPDENPVEQLSKYIFKEENREEGLPYKAVEIFLPLSLLQVICQLTDTTLSSAAFLTQILQTGVDLLPLPLHHRLMLTFYIYLYITDWCIHY